MNSKQFYLGANTPDGFYSLFYELYSPYDDWKMYIIKGGPGTGKSTIMKNIASEAESRNFSVYCVPCSSDPNSLDGVIIPELKIAVADGTSPHTIEPVFPGVCENIIDLSACWNVNKLRENMSKIKMTAMSNTSAHKKSVNYIRTASLIENEIKKYTYPSVDFDKVDRFIKRISDIYFNKDFNEKENATENYRFLTAFTPIGIHFLDDIISECNTVISIKDNIEIGDLIISKLKNEALKNKYNLIICNCPLSPKVKTEHLIIPELSLAFTLSNEYHSFKGNKIISVSRFYNRGDMLKHKNTISYLKNAKREMVNEALESVKYAKDMHDILESYYIYAMDFNKVNEVMNKLIKEIFN